MKIESNYVKEIARNGGRERFPSSEEEYEKFEFRPHRNIQDFKDSGIICVRFFINDESTEWFVNPDYAIPGYINEEMSSELIPELLLMGETIEERISMFTKFERFYNTYMKDEIEDYPIEIILRLFKEKFDEL